MAGSTPDVGEFATCIIKQTAARMTAFGFPNDPRAAKVGGQTRLSRNVVTVAVHGLCEATVAVLYVEKGHLPVQAWHVVDFRVGDEDFYRRDDVAPETVNDLRARVGLPPLPSDASSKLGQE